LLAVNAWRCMTRIESPANRRTARVTAETMLRLTGIHVPSKSGINGDWCVARMARR
jgi:hypothetical protein